MSDVKLGLVMLITHDVERAKTFYTKTVGLHVVPEFSSEESGVVLLKAASGTPLVLQSATMLPGQGDSGPGSTQVAFEVDDVDATYADWKASGIVLQGEINDMGAGRIFYLSDPDGHTIGIYQLYEQTRAICKASRAGRAFDQRLALTRYLFA